MKTLKRTLWLMAFCAVALFGANEAGAVSSGAEARALLEESAALIEQQGFAEQAERVRAQVSILSDDELFEAYESIDLEALVITHVLQALCDFPPSVEEIVLDALGHQAERVGVERLYERVRGADELARGAHVQSHEAVR